MLNSEAVPNFCEAKMGPSRFYRDWAQFCFAEIVPYGVDILLFECGVEPMAKRFRLVIKTKILYGCGTRLEYYLS